MAAKCHEKRKPFSYASQIKQFLMIKILWGYIYSFFKAEILVKELLLRDAY